MIIKHLQLLEVLNSYYAIIIYSFIQMKKNLDKLIAQIEVVVGKKARGGFKITSKNANQFTNKILVDANQYKKPSFAQQYAQEEMQHYRMIQMKAIKDLQDGVKKKIYKPLNLEQQITKLEGCLDILMMEDVMAAIRVAKKEELFLVRPKLIKLEDHLSFTLEQEELQPHMKDPLEAFLKELNAIINKKNTIY